MKKIIIFPGDVNGVFFKNEFPYIQKNFDEGLIITYPTSKMPKFKNFECFQANGKKVGLLFKNKFWKWLFKKEVKEEIKQNFSLSINGIKKLLYILMYGLFYIDSERQVEKFYNNLKNEDTLILYSFWMTRGSYAAVCINEAFNKKTNGVFTRAHGYDLYEDRNTLNYLPFRKAIIEGCDTIYTISKDGKNYLESNYQFYLRDTFLKVNKLGTFSDKEIKEIKQKNKVVIASCSSINQIKRLDRIIDFLSNLDVPFFWIHFGTGELEKKIKNYAFKKLKTGTYDFLGMVNNKEILNIYKEYDIDYFINMSDSEGIPVSIMEAISIGIPVVGLDVGAIKEIVNEKTGFLIDKNVNSFNNAADFIKLRIFDPNKYLQLSKSAKQFWSNNYCAEKNYESFFKELANEDS